MTFSNFYTLDDLPAMMGYKHAKSHRFDQKTEDRRQKTEDRRQKTEDRKQKTEDRKQKTEDRRQKTEDRRQKTEGRRQKTEDRRQKTEDRRQKTEDRRQKTEDRRQKTEDRRQKTEDRRQKIAAKKNSAIESRRLLGIDPGTRCVGWGLIECNTRNQALRLLNCGCIKPSPKLELKSRLCEIFSKLETIIRRERPDAAVLEETFAGNNMKSAIAMGEGRGIALLCLARAKLETLELSPRSIKQAVTGYGAASKSQVAAMVTAQLGLPDSPEPEDVTDALAAAIALARRIKIKN